MTILEIIHLRSAGTRLDELGRQIHQTVGTRAGAADSLVVYRGGEPGSDMAVHLRRECDDPSPRKSALGMRLAEELGAHGLVVHTVWRQL